MMDAIYILKNMSTFERMPFQARNAVFKKLSEITDISALSHEEREKYDESLKYMRDYNASLEGAKIIGQKEGMQVGLKEGMKAGLLESQTNIARMMLNDGESIDKIMRYTGLTEDQIKQLN